MLLSQNMQLSHDFRVKQGHEDYRLQIKTMLFEFATFEYKIIINESLLYEMIGLCKSHNKERKRHKVQALECMSITRHS